MQAHGDLTRSFHLPHHIQHLLQRHFSAVINGAVCLCKAQQGRVHQTARIDDAVGFLKQGRAPPGDEVRCAGACTNKMYHNVTPLPKR